VKESFCGERAKDRKIIEMYYHDYTQDQIAKELHASPNYISSTIKVERMKVEKEKRDKVMAHALQLFSQGKSPLDVCIKLVISADEAFRVYDDYLELTDRYELTKIREQLGKNLPNFINLYQTMKDYGMPKEDIMELSNNYFTIPHARNDLKNLLDDVREQEKKRDQYISDWKKLDITNTNLKLENRNQKNENGDLEKKNKDLKIKNRDLENKNRELQRKNQELEGVEACRKGSFDNKMKDQKSVAPLFLANTEPASRNNNFYMKENTSGDQGPQYKSFDPPLSFGISFDTKLNRPYIVQGEIGSSVSSCHNIPENEIKSDDIVKN
jgi:hypothetical protein